MHRPIAADLRFLVALAGVFLFATAGPARGQESAPKQLAAAKDKDDPAPEDTAPPPADPAGMVRFPGGKTRIGIDEKALKELIAATSLGRMSVPASAIEEEFGPSSPEHEVGIPPFWIGKYETTNAQYDHFLHTRARVVYTVPPAGKPGARTLEEISRMFLLTEPFENTEGKTVHLPTVEWYQLYDINEETLNPTKGPDGKPVDPKSRLPREKWQSLALPEGVKVVTFRHTLPETWKTPVPDNRYQEHYLPGTGDYPVTGVSLIDAQAFARTYGCHIPLDHEWEAAARGEKGSIWPEGTGIPGKAPDFSREFKPLGHAWRGFDEALSKAKPQAAKDLERAKDLLEKARKDKIDYNIRRYEKEVADLQWIVDAHPIDPNFRGDVLSQPVGSYPMGSSPVGAMDMIGNVDEWTSNRLFPYPGSKSRCPWFGYAWSFRGGNLLDMDTILQATFRKFLHNGFPLESHVRSNSGGFRVARYEMPGASTALSAVQAIEQSEVGILPGEIDTRSKSFQRYFTGLDIYAAAGVERLDEVRWSASGSPGNDPAGKVFHLGPARSVVFVPANGTPFKDPNRLRAACDSSAMPAEGQPDKREPRGIPFLGFLHATPGMEIKGEVLTTEYKEVPLTGEALKRWQEERKAERERERAAEAEEEDGEKKDGEGGEKGDGDGKQEIEGGDKAPKPPAGGGEAGKEGEKPAEPPAEEPEPAPTRRVPVFSYQAGFLKGGDYPRGFFLGWVKVGEKRRPALWEARRGVGGSSAPGGHVLLEQPLMLLDEADLEFKKTSGNDGSWSRMDEELGLVTLEFCIPVEPVEKPSAYFKVTLRLHLGDYEAATLDRPWRTRPRR